MRRHRRDRPHADNIPIRSSRGANAASKLATALLDSQATLLDAETLAELAQRPKTRGDCIGGVRPCPWAGCRHSLVIDVSPCGSIKINNPDREAAESCALDVADRGEHTLDAIGEMTNLTRERVRQIEVMGLRMTRRRLAVLR